MQSKKRNKSPEEYDVNPLQFLNPQTPEVAYILGLLWADGHICKSTNRISISILKSDMEHITNIFLKTGKWNIMDHINPNSPRPQRSIRTSNKDIHMFLSENNYKSKSWESADKILSKIPEYLRHYWFRGLVDGDGCLFLNEKKRICHITIASGFDQNWNYLEEFCNKLNINFLIKRRQQMQNNHLNKNSIFCITQHYGIERFGDYIYQNYENDKIGLPRKYKKFLEIKEYIKYKESLRSNKKGSKYIGVVLTKFRTGILARIKINKKGTLIGYFNTELEAAKAYDERAIKEFGSDIKTNAKIFGI